MSSPKFLYPITVTSSNNGLRVWTFALGWSVVNVTPGTYWVAADGAAADLSTTLRLALNAATGAVWTGTVSTTGHYSLTCSVLFSVDLTHADSTIGPLLGYVPADSVWLVAPGTWCSSTNQHQGGWYPGDSPNDDSWHHVARRTHATDTATGRTRQWTEQVTTPRTMRWELLVGCKVLPNPEGPDGPNEDAATMWRHLARGGDVYYFYDVLLVSARASAERYVLASTERSRVFAPERHARQGEWYHLTIPLRRYVT